MSTLPTINIITALPCEAKALISYYQLKLIRQQREIKLYSNKEHTINLAISGLGSIKSAIAATLLATLNPAETNSYYLNIGIAGSENFAVGQLFYIHKVTSAAQDRSYYPVVIKDSKLLQAPLVTYEQPCLKYPSNCLVDMEGYGFFQAARYFTTHEFIHLLKVVSDNLTTPPETISPQSAAQLITDNLEGISKFIANLAENSHPSPIREQVKTVCTAILNTFHFSTYQQHELAELVRRWLVICPDQELASHLTRFQKAKEVLNYLQLTLKQAEYSW